MDESARSAKVAKALFEARFVQTLLGMRESSESVLAEEVRILYGAIERVRVMIHSWRDIAAEQRNIAAHWRTQGESLAWHAIRADTSADLLETQATLLESIFPPHTMKDPDDDRTTE